MADQMTTWRHMVIDGLQLEYLVQGAGEPVLLIHAGVCADFFVPLLAVAAMAQATPAAAPIALEAKNKAARKARKKARKAVEKTCQLQVPLCEVSLSAVCQPGPDVQECLDNTSECCELLGSCDATAAISCIVTNFIV